MADEKKEQNGEMSPQEDGTKVPLTEDTQGAGVEVKFTSESSPNGDAKIDVGPVPTFSGLSKDELMKYSKDPFWVRLRWFLFILFWLSWLAMLVAAIVIIVLAPRCTPPPTLQWVQESPMLQYSNIDDDVTEFIKMMEKMKISTAYIPEVISPKDFTEYVDNTATRLEEISKKMKEANMRLVTEFMADEIPDDHIWTKNESYNAFLLEDQRTFNYSSPGLIAELQGILSLWVNRGFSAFIMNEAEEKEKISARNQLNDDLEEQGGAVVSGIVDMKDELPGFSDSDNFAKFLSSNVANNKSTWKYFKYNPFEAVGETGGIDLNHVPLLTIGLFLVPGTPIFKKNELADDTMNIIDDLVKLREREAIQFGNTTFVSNITDSVVAYTRIQKGTPGYAVAVNLESIEQTIDFSSLKNIPDKGKLKLDFVNGTNAKIETKEVVMKEVKLGSLQAKVIQFVPKYE